MADETTLTEMEQGTLSEVGNICLAKASETLGQVLGSPVSVTPPAVSVVSERVVLDDLTHPSLIISVNYTEGLFGRSVFVLSEDAALLVANKMLGQAGAGLEVDALDDMAISAASEAMNQMMGAMATALADLLEGTRVDIAPPKFTLLHDGDSAEDAGVPDVPVVALATTMSVGEELTTELVQLLPLDFGRQLVEQLQNPAPRAAEPAPAPAAEVAPSPSVAVAPSAVVQPAAFAPLDGGAALGASFGNIGLLEDVSLQVTVELGRTHMPIREILDMTPGAIFELEKLAGEPVDILVNGKLFGKGEVVVIDENFGVRITEIANARAGRPGVPEIAG